MTEETISINVGPLNGIGSLCYHTAKPLRTFSDLYMKGRAPEVEFDLRGVEPRRMSMAGLTAFLAIAHRLRQFTGHAQLARVLWNPDVFGFWDDISLLEIVKEHDLLEWPKDKMGGYEHGKTNPNTRLLVFESANPPYQQDLERWKWWKDETRQTTKKDLSLKCRALFGPQSGKIEFPESLKDQIAITMSELVVNSLLHGRSTPFVGLQRTSRGISVAVCDAGVGFLNSFRQRRDHPIASQLKTNIEALFWCSLVNHREIGLRRAIATVVRHGGWVLLSSVDAELRWTEELWQRASQVAIEGISATRLPDLRTVIGAPVTGSVTSQQLSSGYHRIWDCGLRGARITFEIPLSGGHGSW